ncbi:unnamed protein product [Effrenium voratum]|nr:unnamed protein product [Effrenium voratum]CAJ1456401.1 unnamed protein product [Effrenium voratum]
MLSLFMSIAGGVSWVEVLAPLKFISSAWTVCFLFYIAFTYFAVLNVVTAVFCQSAIEAAQSDQVTMVQTLLDNKESHLKKFKALFSELGAEDSGRRDMSFDFQPSRQQTGTIHEHDVRCDPLRCSPLQDMCASVMLGGNMGLQGWTRQNVALQGRSKCLPM